MNMVKVVKVYSEGNSTTVLQLDMDLDFTPGQFLMVWCPRIGEKPFTIASSNTITVRNVGPTSWRLNNIKPGEFVGVRGPLGKGFKAVKDFSIIIAGGTGLASVASLIPYVPSVVLYGENTSENRIYRKRLEKDNVIFYTIDGSEGRKGYPTDHLEHYIWLTKAKQVYCCGPKLLIDKVIEICKNKEVPCQICMEAHMKCATGICGSCTCGNGLLTCKDGPVFNSEDLYSF